MPTLYLIRHGKAGSTWDDRDPDPGLTDVGRAQAEARAAALAEKGPLPIVCSPLRRTRETAAPLERHWSTKARIEPRVGEISAPANAASQRTEWLKGFLDRRWSEVDASLSQWRNQILQAIREITGDTVVVSHFVAINVVVGEALADDRVTCFRPENCSCTVIDLKGQNLKLIELGSEGPGRIL